MAREIDLDADYEVGFGKPPKSGRFKPGQSGNPSGKRRGKHFKTLLEEELAVELSVTEGNKTVKISKAGLVAKSLVNQAVKGELRAIEMLTRLAGNADADDQPTDLASIPPAVITNYLKRHAPASPPEPDEMDGGDGDAEAGGQDAEDGDGA